jgi:hypothetical protein
MNELPKCRRVEVELVPKDQIQVCGIGPSLEQKEKDGTITESEKRVLQSLRIFSITNQRENEEQNNKQTD